MRIQAGQIVAPGRVELVSIPAPEPGEGKTRARPTIGCLCGSALPYFHADSANPMVAGRTAPLEPSLSLHELIGVVDATRCRQYQEGDPVVGGAAPPPAPPA